MLSLAWSEQTSTMCQGMPEGAEESNYSEFHTAALVSKHDSRQCRIYVNNVRKQRETWDNLVFNKNTNPPPLWRGHDLIEHKRCTAFVLGRIVIDMFALHIKQHCASCQFFSALPLLYVWKTTLILSLAPRWNMEMRISMLAYWMLPVCPLINSCQTS